MESISINEKTIKNKYLVIYDLSNDKRRYILSRLLEGFGYRVQYSAFECVLTTKQYNKMIKSIDAIKKDDDNIRIYPLSMVPVCYNELNNVNPECDLIFI